MFPLDLNSFKKSGSVTNSLSLANAFKHTKITFDENLNLEDNVYVDHELTAPNLKKRFQLWASVRTVQKYINFLRYFSEIYIFYIN